MRTIFTTRAALLLSGATCFTIQPRHYHHRAATKTLLKMGQLITDGNDPEDVERDYMGLLKSPSPQTSKKNGKWGSSETWTAGTEVQLGGDDPEDLISVAKAAVEKAEAMELSGEQTIPVKFVNFDEGNPLKQTTVHVTVGTNILKVGDEVGIRIPRQCRSGLCGSCTGDIKDPTWEEGPREGYQTVRLCQAGAMIPFGTDEMVVDLYRLIDSTSGGDRGTVVAGGEGAREASLRVSTGGPSMTNFEDGWEDNFVPAYKSSESKTNLKTRTKVSISAPKMTNFDDGWEDNFVPDYKSGGKDFATKSPRSSSTPSKKVTTRKSSTTPKTKVSIPAPKINTFEAPKTKVSIPAPKMTNFEDGWEDNFIPDYKSGGKDASAITVSKPSLTPEYTVGKKTERSVRKKLRRWSPNSFDNIAPWDIVG